MRRVGSNNNGSGFFGRRPQIAAIFLALLLGGWMTPTLVLASKPDPLKIAAKSDMGANETASKPKRKKLKTKQRSAEVKSRLVSTQGNKPPGTRPARVAIATGVAAIGGAALLAKPATDLAPPASATTLPIANTAEQEKMQQEIQEIRKMIEEVRNAIRR